jgi:molybdopterin/thiamine biosynthesis adenylyltransferase|tara:strand:+ start:973 stop:2010 length:1038 start_codon:yes stop_codon:yes gene_type:complete
MILAFLSLLILAWFLAGYLGVSQNLRATYVGILLAGILGALVLIPETHSFSIRMGGWAPWATISFIFGVVFLFRLFISALRNKSNEIYFADVQEADEFSNHELERYSRHIILRELGGLGQRRIKDSKVLIIGAGGLGAPIIQYLAASGVGTIGIIDHDKVSLSNLQRQVIYLTNQVGEQKVFSAADAIYKLNSNVNVRPYNRRLNSEIAEEIFSEYDVIVDGTDNFETRYIANAAATTTKKPLVSGALSQWEGQVSVFAPHQGGPCYACVFPTPPKDGLALTCSEGGVFSPLPGVVGSVMAVETLKILSQSGETLLGQMFIYDGLRGESRKIKLKPIKKCPVCSS